MSNNTESLNVKLALSGLAAVEAGMKQVANSIADMGRMATSILPALAGLGSVFAVKELVSSSMEFSEAIELAGKKSGITADKFLALGYAAEMSKVHTDDLQLSLKHFSKHLEASGRGHENMLDALMLEAALFQRLPDGAEKTALALEHFGKAGEQMIPFLDKGPVAIQALIDESQRYGVINSSAGIITERFNQSNVRLHAAMRGLGTEIGSNIYPGMTRLTNAIAGAVATVRDFVSHEPEVVAMAKALALASASMTAISVSSKIGGLIGGGFAAVGGVKSIADLVAYIRLLPAIAGASAAALGVVVLQVVALAAVIYTVKKAMDMLDAQNQALLAATDRAATVGKLNDKVFETFRKLRGEGLINAEQAEEMLKPLRDAAKSGDIDKLQSALTKVAVALRAIQGSSPEGNKTIWTQQELDRQEKLLSIEEKKIRLTMERDKMERIPGATGSPAASTGDSQPQLQSIIRQRRAMLEEAHKQGAVSDDEYAERSIKLDEDKLKLQQEINSDFRAGQSESNALLDDELQTKREALALDKERIQNNFLMTDAEKLAAERALLGVEKEQIQTALEHYQWELKFAVMRKDAIAYKEAQRKISGLEKDSAGVDGKLGENKADPKSFADQFGALGTKLRGQLTPLATQTAAIFESVFNSAISSIGKGITGLITGTATWGKALQQIGNSILTSLIQGIVDMGVKWVLTHVLMTGAMMAFHAIRSMLGWAATGEAIAQETAKAPALATNAATASIGSWGTAALIGIAALVAGIAVGKAAGGFAEGGYTGAGGKYDIAGFAHRGEYVMPAHAVSSIGLPALENMRRGGGGGRGGGDVHVHYWDDKQAMTDHIRVNTEVQHVIMNIVSKNAHIIARR